jgi:hypothetical protein
MSAKFDLSPLKKVSIEIRFHLGKSYLTHQGRRRDDEINKNPSETSRHPAEMKHSENR